MTLSYPRRRWRRVLATAVSAATLGALVAVAAWFVWPSQAATGATPDAGGTYTLSVLDSGLCLDAAGVDTSSGAPLDQSACTAGTTSQQFRLVNAGSDRYQLINVHTGLCVASSAGVSATPDTPLIPSACGMQDSQFWTFEETPRGYRIVNVSSGLCMSDRRAGTAQDNRIVQETCVGDGTLWSFAVVAGTTPTATGFLSPAPPAAASTTTSPSPTKTSASPSPGKASTTPTKTTTTSRHFRLLTPGAALPSGAQCATAVRAVPIAENKAVNATANRIVGEKVPGAKAPITRVDGHFTGTTEQILRWAACKWGIDEDMVKAQAAVESWWRMDNKGDWGTDASRCPANHEPGVDGKPGSCPESYGMLQVRYPYNLTAFPGVEKSTAMNTDYAYAVWRDCYEGRMTWLNTVERGSKYAAGDAWGCMGVHFSGRWYTAAADGYIARVKDYLAQRIWKTPNFQQP